MATIKGFNVGFRGLMVLDAIDDALGGVVVDAFEMLHADAHAETHEIGDFHAGLIIAEVELLLQLGTHADADRAFRLAVCELLHEGECACNEKKYK